MEVETSLDNTAEDYRLRVLFPTDAVTATTYLAREPYDFVERRIALDPRTIHWQESEQAEKPFLGLQAVGDGRRGLAFLSAGGPHEGGVMDDRRRMMRVTLLRSFRKTISTGSEPDGLERGPPTYRFALLPYAGQLPRADALQALAQLQADIMTRQTGPRSSGFPPMTGSAAPTRQFIETQGDDSLSPPSNHRSKEAA